MIRKARHIVILLLFSILTTGISLAQRISFGLHATEGITMNTGTVDALDFNAKQHIIIGGSSVQILLTEEFAAIITIEARADLDVTITIDAPATLDLDASNQIPLALRFAYSNLGAGTEAIAKTEAVEVPSGFDSVTFPVYRRSSGVPAPPPTPGHVGYTATKRTAYLFVYGTLGPLPINAAAGFYTGTINISASD